jgi:hypothetical protein
VPPLDLALAPPLALELAPSPAIKLASPPALTPPLALELTLTSSLELAPSPDIKLTSPPAYRARAALAYQELAPPWAIPRSRCSRPSRGVAAASFPSVVLLRQKLCFHGEGKRERENQQVVLL